MAGTIKYDQEGSSVNAGKAGTVWNRRYLIEGMINGPDIPSLILEAYALIPDTGTAGPLTNVFVRDSSIDRIWCENPPTGTLWSASGVITYTTPTRVGGTLGTPDDNGAGVVISGSSSVVELRTDRDVGGNQIVTTYDGIQMAHEVTAFGIARTLELQRLENTRPDTRKDLVEGRLNQFAWNGYSALSVLCSAIDWSSDDGGDTWSVTYSFSIRDDWIATATHEDPYFPGRPLAETDPGWTTAARTTWDVIPAADFGVLDIVL